jgi:polyketide cyclase/dehydrase/lipid transport protein
MAMTGTAVTGPRRADEVWDRYADYERWPEWSPYIQDVRVDGGELATGATGVVRAWAGTSVEFVVDDWDPGRRTWTWTVRPRMALPPVGLPMLRLGHGVRPAGSGSLAWLTLRGSAPLVYGAFVPERLALYRLVH